jgi:hypothetical protein
MKRIVTVSLSFSSALLLSFLALGIAAPAWAKGAAIKVPDVIQIQSGVESLLPIEIDIADGGAMKAMLLIRGIPATAALTEGRLFPSGIWAIKPTLIDKLRVITSSTAVEDVDLVFTLVALEGDPLSTASAKLLISPNVAAPQTPRGSVPVVAVTRESDLAKEPPPPPALIAPRAKPSLEGPKKPPSSAKSPRDWEKVAKIMERGDRYLVEGKIDFARRFYQLAVDMGSPEGAEAIARTYDPDYLERFPIVGGITANKALAEEWYNKAKDIRTNAQNNRSEQEATSSN